MSVCPICKDDSKIMQRCLYCSGLFICKINIRIILQKCIHTIICI